MRRSRAILVLLLVAALAGSTGILQAYAELNLGNERYIRDLDGWENGPLNAAQKCSFYDEAYDYHYVFYGDTGGNDIWYVSTDDNGTTWSSPLSVGSDTQEDIMYYFDLYYFRNASGVPRVAFFRTAPCGAVGCGIVRYRTGTCQSDGTISWDGAEDAILNGDNAQRANYNPNVAIDSAGYPWLSVNQLKISDYSLTVWKGTNRDTSVWTDETGFDGADALVLDGPNTDGIYASLIVPFKTASGVAILYNQVAAGLYARISKTGTSTFQVEDQITTITLSHGATAGGQGFSAVCDDNDDVHVVFMADNNNSIMTSTYDYDADAWTPASTILDLGAGYWGNSWTTPRASWCDSTGSVFVFWEYMTGPNPTGRDIQYMERYSNGTWGTNATALTWDVDMWATAYGSFEVVEDWDVFGDLVYMSNEGLLGTPSIWLLPFYGEAPPAPPGPTLVEVQLYPGWVPWMVKAFAILGPFGFIAVMWRKVETFWDGVYLFVLCILCFIAAMVIWTIGEGLGEVITQYEYQ